jgi:hypothetical protein
MCSDESGNTQTQCVIIRIVYSLECHNARNQQSVLMKPVHSALCAHCAEQIQFKYIPFYAKTAYATTAMLAMLTLTAKKKVLHNTCGCCTGGGMLLQLYLHEVCVQWCYCTTSTTTADCCVCDASVYKTSPEAPSVLKNDVECVDDTCSKGNVAWCLDVVRKQNSRKIASTIAACKIVYQGVRSKVYERACCKVSWPTLQQSRVQLALWYLVNLATHYNACDLPGMKPSIVSNMLMTKSAVHPTAVES